MTKGKQSILSLHRLRRLIINIMLLRRFYSTFNKTTQLLDLERYLFQQAELGRRKTVSPRKRKPSLSSGETATVSCKKQKVNASSKFIGNSKRKKLKKTAIINGDSVGESMTHRPTSDRNNVTISPCTRKTRLSIDTEIQCKASTSRTGMSAGLDQIEAANISKDCIDDSDPGSEYLPSDEQPDSGTKNYLVDDIICIHSKDFYL